MALSDTAICNLALGRIGASRLNDLDTDTSEEARHCRLLYQPVRDALLRSHFWRFALARAELSEDTDSPAFEYDSAFILPTDFLRMVGLYDTTATYSLEGKRLLTNDESASILYVRKVTDVTEFDPLFVDLLTLTLAVRLSTAIGRDRFMRRELQEELRELRLRVMTADRQETNTTGTDDLNLWLNVRT